MKSLTTLNPLKLCLQHITIGQYGTAQKEKMWFPRVRDIKCDTHQQYFSIFMDSFVNIHSLFFVSS